MHLHRSQVGKPGLHVGDQRRGHLVDHGSASHRTSRSGAAERCLDELLDVAEPADRAVRIGRSRSCIRPRTRNRCDTAAAGLEPQLEEEASLLAGLRTAHGVWSTGRRSPFGHEAGRGHPPITGRSPLLETVAQPGLTDGRGRGRSRLRSGLSRLSSASERSSSRTRGTPAWAVVGCGDVAASEAATVSGSGSTPSSSARMDRQRPSCVTASSGSPASTYARMSSRWRSSRSGSTATARRARSITRSFSLRRPVPLGKPDESGQVQVGQAAALGERPLVVKPSRKPPR